ncbi:MAG: hypothetical protein D3910_07205 [Candidatus Electrothrix sp. ATG2]|nr:hypothetical protein [Candidatus Electrothrix sp. ATG2]
MIINKLIFPVIITIAIFVMAGCSSSDRSASCTLADNGVSISIELSPSHPFLAEYDRFLILKRNGKEVAKQKLFQDTGGYSSANLYKCNHTLYMVKGYFDMWVIDLNSGRIEDGQCPKSAHEYIGIFDGGGSKPWKFYLSSEREEQELKPKGG